ncbi:hypothetical protein OG21DRAFT_1507686 [Imleria badia]|nr:hypothetical protein OG21DRAFT_1507686 [Imleria badia]
MLRVISEAGFFSQGTHGSSSSRNSGSGPQVEGTSAEGSPGSTFSSSVRGGSSVIRRELANV